MSRPCYPDMQALDEKYGGYCDVPDWELNRYKAAKRAWHDGYVRDLPKPNLKNRPKEPAAPWYTRWHKR